MDLPSTATSETTAKSTSPRTSRKIKVNQDPTLGKLPPPPAEPQSQLVELAPIASLQSSAGMPADVSVSEGLPLENFGPLPATYHHDTLFLTARDPRWLFAYWDFDWGRVPASRMREGRNAYFLKVTRKDGLLEALVEINPSARNWYVPVSTAGMCYVAELGYFELSGGWRALVYSGEAHTPADVLAPEGKDEVFATVPQTLTFAKLQELVHQHMEDGETLLGAIARITGEGRIQVQRGVTPSWSPEQKRLLAMLLGESLIDAVGLGSEEIDRLLRKALQQKLHSEAASGLGARLAAAFGPSSFHLASLFSPMGASWSTQPFGVGRERGFFMHLNAEVIFYGGTQPDARVTVNGEEIQLQPDGTFRYHFTLPDGDFEIPICATSADGQEERSGTLSFRRQTRRVGAVGASAQPQHLEPLMGRRTA
ncbi:MAG: hypothetical protein RLZZ399_2407 [Verrucomicrobiota bacterium]|jgi:hypothetical protein